MNWGKWIVVSFLLFGTLVAGLVTISMRQEVNLVERDYYQRELAYQEQIERLQNTEVLAVKPTFEVTSSEIVLRYANLNQIQKGTLRLFRPSDSRLDQTFEVASSDDSVFRQELTNTARGLYRIQFNWSIDDKEYYIESIVNL